MANKESQEEALRRVKEELKNIDLTARCKLLNLPAPENNALKLRVFGRDMILGSSDLNLIIKENKKPAKLRDNILILHYLLNDRPIHPNKGIEKQITFRQFSGGQFYWQPFLSRTAVPLIKRIGNDLDLLKKNLGRFDWEEVNSGDLGAKIHTIGELYITLIYHRGDDEFPPAADILFDECIKDVFSTEDASVLASRICIGLL